MAPTICFNAMFHDQVKMDVHQRAGPHGVPLKAAADLFQPDTLASPRLFSETNSYDKDIN